MAVILQSSTLRKGSLRAAKTKMVRKSAGCMGLVKGPHLDLNRAPYCLYGVKYIDPVPPAHLACGSHLDLGRALYCVHGVKYIDLVSLGVFPGA